MTKTRTAIVMLVFFSSLSSLSYAESYENCVDGNNFFKTNPSLKSSFKCLRRYSQTQTNLVENGKLYNFEMGAYYDLILNPAKPKDQQVVELRFFCYRPNIASSLVEANNSAECVSLIPKFFPLSGNANSNLAPSQKYDLVWRAAFDAFKYGDQKVESAMGGGITPCMRKAQGLIQQGRTLPIDSILSLATSTFGFWIASVLPNNVYDYKAPVRTCFYGSGVASGWDSFFYAVGGVTEITAALSFALGRGAKALFEEVMEKMRNHSNQIKVEMGSLPLLKIKPSTLRQLPVPQRSNDQQTLWGWTKSTTQKSMLSLASFVTIIIPSAQAAAPAAVGAAAGEVGVGVTSTMGVAEAASTINGVVVPNVARALASAAVDSSGAAARMAAPQAIEAIVPQASRVFASVMDKLAVDNPTVGQLTRPMLEQAIKSSLTGLNGAGNIATTVNRILGVFCHALGV